MSAEHGPQEKILLVDDNQNVLEAFCRGFHEIYNLETAASAEEAVAIIARKGPYAVVVSDMRMPGQDGIQLLATLKRISPDTVRIMLTGYADTHSAIAAVNQGSVFRFLTKPCSLLDMNKALEDALRQYRLVIAEKQLLEQTLKGSIKVLSELLALVNPPAFGRANRIHTHVRQLALHMGMTDTWELEYAALLSQIGCLLQPAETVLKLKSGEPLTAEEQGFLDMHPVLAADLLSHIPRLEGVREMIANQGKHFDGQGLPVNGKSGTDIPLGARVLKILVDFEHLETSGKSAGQTLEIMRSNKGCYDPMILDTLEKVLGWRAGLVERKVRLEELEGGMILAEDVLSLRGLLLVPKGQEVNQVLLTSLRTFAGIGGVREPITVFVPGENKVQGAAAPPAG